MENCHDCRRLEERLIKIWHISGELLKNQVGLSELQKARNGEDLKKIYHLAYLIGRVKQKTDKQLAQEQLDMDVRGEIQG